MFQYTRNIFLRYRRSAGSAKAVRVSAIYKQSLKAVIHAASAIYICFILRQSSDGNALECQCSLRLFWLRLCLFLFPSCGFLPPGHPSDRVHSPSPSPRRASRFCVGRITVLSAPSRRCFVFSCSRSLRLYPGCASACCCCRLVGLCPCSCQPLLPPLARSHRRRP